MIQYSITYERAGTTRTLYADYSGRVQGLTFATNNRGFAECTGFVPMSLAEAFALYERLGTLRVQIIDTSAGIVYDGRIEDIGITGMGASITALGFSRALGDLPYTAMWSMSDATQFRPTRTDELAIRNTELYTFDTNNRLLIGLRDGATYGNVADVGGMVYQLPVGSSRQIIGVSFDAVVSLPLNWLFQLNQWSVNYGGVAPTAIITGNGGTQVLSQLHTFAGCEYLEFVVYNNTGGNYALVDPFGTKKVMITNVRPVTATTNMVSTTATVAFSFTTGVSVSITVGSTARMYAGMRLYLPTNGYSATVDSITSATVVMVTFSQASAGPFPIGTAIQAFVIYADEIAKHLVSVTNTLNSNQLSSATALITSPAVDLISESYEDQRPADVLDYLVTFGDSAGNPWEWGVKADQRLYLRRQGNGSVRTWYIDVSNLDVRQLLDNLNNSVYAVYQEASGRTLRTAATSDTGSVQRFGLTRRTALPVSTTSAAQAAFHQATALNDGKNPRPQSGVTVDRVFDASGAAWPLWYVSAGDTVVIRNLPPTLSSTIDRVRIFRLARVEYAFENDTLSLEPETPVPSLDALLARVSPPSWVTAPWWVQVMQK